MGPPNLTNAKDKKALERNAQAESPPQVAGEKTSLEILLESTERTVPLASQQFGMMRDSLVFNHERIHHPALLNHRSEESPTRHVGTTPHNPSRNMMNSQVTPRTNPRTPVSIQDEDEFILSTAPKLISMSDRTTQNRVNANLDRHVVWQLPEPQIPPAGIQEQYINDSSSGLSNNLIQCDTSEDIPLTNTAASLHLPSPPTSGMFYGEMYPPPSVTTVTTVYAYKCNRTSRHVDGEQVTRLNEKLSDPLYEERTQEVPYHYGSHMQQANLRITPVVRESEEQMEMRDQYEQQHDGNSNVDVEAKFNAINLPTVDHATTDEDLDDESGTLHNNSQPVFPNPANLRWPEIPYLRATLDPRYHPFLEPNCKKDCRIWFWKNENGRKARELLAMGKALSKSANPGYQHITTTADVHNTIKAFRDNDDLEEEEDITVGISQ